MISEERISRLTGLFQARYGLVVAAAERYAPSPSDIDDVTQQVYIDFILGAAKGSWNEENWEDENEVGALLYQIAKRKAQVLWRERRFRADDAIEILAERLYDRSCGKDDELGETDLRIQALRKCIEALAPNSRAILEQHYFESVPMKSIAKSLDKQENAVYRFFFRLRAKLHECIERKTRPENG